MADARISELNPRTIFTGGEEFPTLADGVNYRSPVALLRTFTNDGSGAVPRTVADRLADSVHLLDFIPVEEHAAIFDGTSTYDATAAFYNCMNSVLVNELGAIRGGPEIILPYGKVFFASTLEIDKTILLKGHASGAANVGYGTILEWPKDTHGLVLHTGYTLEIDKGARVFGAGTGSDPYKFWDLDDYVLGGTVSGSASILGLYKVTTINAAVGASIKPTHASGIAGTADGYAYEFRKLATTSVGTTIRDLCLVAQGPNDPGPTRATLGHGIWSRGRCYIDNVRIYNFGQDGVHIHATSAADGGITKGNANNCLLHYVTATNNGRHGFYFDGADANAGLMSHLDATDNWAVGIYDGSYLGNTHVMEHTRDNGTGAKATHDGDRWYTIDPSRTATVAPGTDTSVWVKIGDGTAGATYGPYNPATTYVRGEAFYADSNNSQSVVIGLYVETGQPLPYAVAPWIFIGSAMMATESTALRFAQALSGELVLDNGIRCFSKPGATPSFYTHINRMNDEALSVLADGDHATGLGLLNWHDVTGCWVTQHARTLTRTPVYYTTNLSDGSLPGSTAVTCGRSNPIGAGQVVFPQGIWVGGNNFVASARKIAAANVIPTTGEWAAGDMVLNNEPLLGEPWGWRCVLAGTPGTWQPLRDIGSQQTINAVNVTLTPGTSPYHTLVSGALAADRTATLSKTGALIGLSYKITRTATGAFNLNILNGAAGPTLKALAANTWAECAYDGTDYYIAAYGAL